MRSALALSALCLWPQNPAVTWAPTTPLQGSLLHITAAGSPGDTAAPRASLADEPLHFERDPAGRWVALAAVPLSATESVTLWVGRSGRDSVSVIVPVAPRPSGVEQLRTDTAFTAPLDSALAERVRRETERVVATLRRAHDRPRLWTEPFRPPRPTRVTSPFGQGRRFNGGEARGRHRGTDFAGARGASVQAANRGVVVLVDQLYFAGRAVYVAHGAGIVTSYLHLDTALVAVGDTVSRGQLIGRVGASGRVTGPHLHWAAFFGRVPFDPVDLLSLR